MKKIKILALLVIVAFVVQDLVDGFRGATDGWQAAGDSTEHSTHFDLSVRPDDTFVPDTLRSIATGTETPYWATRIEAYSDMKPSVLQMVCVGVAALLALFVLYGIYCLIRLVIAVLQGSVFTRKNVRRMRLLLKFYYPSQKKMKLSKMVIFRFKQFAIMQKSSTLIRELL